MVLCTLQGAQQSRPPKNDRASAINSTEAEKPCPEYMKERRSDAYQGFCFYINYGLEKMIIIQNNF